jgi:hypothetical protein
MKEIAPNSVIHEIAISARARWETSKSGVKTGILKNGHFGVKTAKNSVFGHIYGIVHEYVHNVCIV